MPPKRSPLHMQGSALKAARSPSLRQRPQRCPVQAQGLQQSSKEPQRSDRSDRFLPASRHRSIFPRACGRRSFDLGPFLPSQRPLLLRGARGMVVSTGRIFTRRQHLKRCAVLGLRLSERADARDAKLLRLFQKRGDCGVGRRYCDHSDWHGGML